MKIREEINPAMTIDLIVQMSEGNMGAISVITEIVKKEHGFMVLLHLDDMNIRGSQIWIGYKYHCSQNLEEFIKCVIARDQDMINKINEMNGQHGGDDWRAIPNGASSGNRPKFPNLINEQ